MSLIKRKARPIKRDKTTLRDDRLFIIACDDTYAPHQYFSFLCIPRIQVHVVPTTDGTSSAGPVLERLLQFEHDDDDELWLLLDTDHYTKKRHIKKFITTIKKAKQKGVKIALSKPCFELWLLLHHVKAPSVRSLANATEVERQFRATLKEFNKKRLKSKHYPPDLISHAIKEAEELDRVTNGEDIPDINTSRVYLLLKAIISKALPSQLPPSLAKTK